MIKKSILFFTAFSLLSGAAFSQKKDSLKLREITNDILLNGKCYSWLDYMCNRIGGRLSGSPQAAAAVEYTYQVMKSLGVDTVYLQECMVPHWIRGEKEEAKILTTKTGEYPAAICALGGSVPTPPEGILAE